MLFVSRPISCFTSAWFCVCIAPWFPYSLLFVVSSYLGRIYSFLFWSSPLLRLPFTYLGHYLFIAVDIPIPPFFTHSALIMGASSFFLHFGITPRLPYVAGYVSPLVGYVCRWNSSRLTNTPTIPGPCGYHYQCASPLLLCSTCTAHLDYSGCAWD